MSTAQSQLPDASLAWFQDLIRANIDSRDAFQEGAAILKPGSSLATAFSRAARQRGAHVDELQDLVACHDELPRHAGTLSGAIHRVWMDVRAVFGGGEAAMLAEAEREEVGLLHHYEKAVEALHECEGIDLIRRQYAEVKTSHERIRALREQCCNSHSSQSL